MKNLKFNCEHPTYELYNEMVGAKWDKFLSNEISLREKLTGRKYTLRQMHDIVFYEALVIKKIDRNNKY